jgi:hypothetical protein
MLSQANHYRQKKNVLYSLEIDVALLSRLMCSYLDMFYELYLDGVATLGDCVPSFKVVWYVDQYTCKKKGPSEPFVLQ